MKLVTTVAISVCTTLLALALLMWAFGVSISAPIDSHANPQGTRVRQLIHREFISQEDAQISAIETVAEAIVGIMAYSGTTDASGRRQGGIGSGIVYAVRDGHTFIATNEHVVSGAASLEVVFNDELQTRQSATLVGKDVYTDVAVIKIENFEANVVAQFGRTEDLRIGQSVIAIGNPLGLEFAGSATMGVVSGHDRSVPIEIRNTNGRKQKWFMTVLQTDTAINPGNSGGALINLYGEVVGINSMKIADAAIDGMSFSIPTYIALPIIEDLENYGSVMRPVLGIGLHNLNTITEVHRLELKIPEELRHGVFVDTVVEDSLAASMGIQVGDVVVRIGDVDIYDTLAFRQTLFTYRHGDDIEMTVVRGGMLHHLNATINVRSSQ